MTTERTPGGVRPRHAGTDGATYLAGSRGTFVYLPQFLATAEADRLYRALMHEVCWRQEWLHLFGRRVAVPRLLAWCGAVGLNYRYSGADHVCDGWLPLLADLRRRLHDELGIAANMVLMNRYRGGMDYMGWHTDDERGLAGVIASVSLGATRRFLLERPGQTGSRRLDLAHGSMLVMDGRLRHSLPRTTRAVGERINLTFRHLQPPQR